MTISTAYPNILTNGTPADATQVMGDFFQIQNDVNANAAHNGANSDITSLTGLTTPLGVVYGGTGANNGASALTNLGAAPLASPNFTGAATITGTLNVSGLITGSNNLDIVSVVASGSIAITGGLSVGANTALTGSLTVGATLGVTGATTLGSATGVTVAATDNTTKLATTAFVNAFAAPAQSLGANGYVKLPGGLIIQWGSFNTGGSSGTVTFPLAFPNGVYNVTGTCQSNGTINICSVDTVSPPTTSQATFRTWAFSAGAAETVNWIAIGH